MIRLLPLLLLLGGCTALKAPERLDTMRLAPRFGPGAAPMQRGRVQVSPVAAVGAVADRRYVYVLAADPLVLRQAATFFWEVPPAMTIGQALTDALRTRFDGMDNGPVVGRLSSRLVRFEEVSGDGRARAVVAIETTFAAAAGTVLTGRYCSATPIAGDGSGERAAAFQASVAQAVQRIADDIAARRMTLSDC